MPGATGRITWPGGRAEGLQIIEIWSPDVPAPFAVLVSAYRGPSRHGPKLGESADAFTRRITEFAKTRADIEVLKIFLPVPKRRIVRERL
jgi:hypothetical protein